MRKIFLALLLPLAIYSQNNPSPEQIEKQLQNAQSQYERTKEMFNPWYTGPLITPSSSMLPPGQFGIQSYLIVTGNYASFNKDRHSISLPHNVYNLKSPFLLWIGITDTMDMIITPTGTANWSDHKNGGGFGDLPVTIGFPIARDTLYVPNIKFTIQQTFPTGKYKNLSTNGLGLNATGGGSYQTQFGLSTSKLIWWTYPHPMKLRYFIGYTLETPIHVTGFNAYGGGFGTNGTVKPGNTLSTDFGMEVSFSQRWVFALDVVYLAQNRTKFHGNPGTTATGAPAAVGGGYNDNLSLAPAIEYNWSSALGMIGGVQFSVYGRNSLNFVNGQFSVSYAW